MPPRFWSAAATDIEDGTYPTAPLHGDDGWDPNAMRPEKAPKVPDVSPNARHLRHPLAMGKHYAHVAVHLSPHIEDGKVYATHTNMWIGTLLTDQMRWEREITYVREEARHIVRKGLADVLAWLGEPVGTAPVRDLSTDKGKRIMAALSKQIPADRTGMRA